MGFFSSDGERDEDFESNQGSENSYDSDSSSIQKKKGIKEKGKKGPVNRVKD